MLNPHAQQHPADLLANLGPGRAQSLASNAAASGLQGHGRLQGPRITVITPVLNGVRSLEQCILSVANQTYAAVEFVVIDGGSVDGSLDVIKRHAQSIAFWVSEPDMGIYDAMNKGIHASTGDWVCVLGSDDQLAADDVLERMVPFLMDCDPGIKLAYGSVAISDGAHTLCLVSPPWTKAKPRLEESTSVLGTGLFHRRSWFERYGHYDTSFRIAGDYEMLLRGWPMEDALHVPEVLTVAVGARGISNVSATAFESLRELRRAQAMHRIEPPVLSRCKTYVHTVARFVLQRVWTETAMWKIKHARASLARLWSRVF